MYYIINMFFGYELVEVYWNRGGEIGYYERKFRNWKEKIGVFGIVCLVESGNISWLFCNIISVFYN